MPRGPMAKHPSARRRGNAAVSTAREIVLRNENDPLLPVPELPPRYLSASRDVDPVEVEWHPEAVKTWVTLWQYPLVYQAPAADYHLLQIYISTIDDYWRRLERGRPTTELINQIRMLSEQWGIGEKSRRHLQITIQEAEEAMQRGAKQSRQVQADAVPTSTAYELTWTAEDEDIDAVVVE